MTTVLDIFERVTDVMLALAHGACGPADQPETGEPEASGQSASSMEASDEALDGAAESAPEPDRFANMFISEVTHDFNPGLPIGAQFPAIRALFEGEEIMSIDRFIRDRGAIFIAARSVDW